MTATLSPNPKQQFFASNGTPLVGGKLYSYQAGTSTPLVTYVDQAATTTNANPIILDSRGEANVWLGTAAYKLALYTATDVLVWTVDNISAADALALADLSQAAGSSLVGYLPAGTGAVATTVQSKLRDVVSVKDFGAIGNGTADDTAAVQAAITYASANGFTLYTPPGVYNHTGLTVSKPLRWVGSAVRGPVYGIQTGFLGAVFNYTPTTGDAITITAASLPSNQGLCVELEHLVFEGNKNVVGAASGGGINLIGDTAGEAFFICSSAFRSVYVRNAKGSAWTITGTCFSNDWWNCGGSYAGGYGLTHNMGSGSPVNNNWHGGTLNDCTLAGLNCNGGKMTMNTVNISQNAGGGVIQDSGYLILNECDLEANTGTAITVTNSSPSTRIHGGMIHKTPGVAAATGISWGAGCAGCIVDGVLFANFDNVADRLVAFSGGASIALFDYRVQNCLAGSFPTSVWANIERIPKKEKVIGGTVTPAGTGVGTRTGTITFPTAFESAYTITISIFQANYDTTKTWASIDADTQTLSTIRTRLISTDAGVGAVTLSYIAVGR